MMVFYVSVVFCQAQIGLGNKTSDVMGELFVSRWRSLCTIILELIFTVCILLQIVERFFNNNNKKPTLKLVRAV